MIILCILDDITRSIYFGNKMFIYFLLYCKYDIKFQNHEVLKIIVQSDSCFANYALPLNIIAFKCTYNDSLLDKF